MKKTLFWIMVFAISIIVMFGGVKRDFEESMTANAEYFSHTFDHNEESFDPFEGMSDEQVDGMLMADQAALDAGL